MSLLGKEVEVEISESKCSCFVESCYSSLSSLSLMDRCEDDGNYMDAWRNERRKGDNM